jgi:hypothetical protein
METSEVIKEGFRDLLKTVPYDKITIVDICQAAAIAKRTLYKYFENKPELVQAIYYDDFIVPLVEVRKILPIDEMKSSQTHLSERDLKTLKDKRVIYENLLKNYGRMELIDLMIKNTQEFNHKVYTIQNFSIDDVEFASYFVATSSVMAKIRWMEGGFKESPERMAKLINDYSLSHLMHLRNSFT